MNEYLGLLVALAGIACGGIYMHFYFKGAMERKLEELRKDEPKRANHAQTQQDESFLDMCDDVEKALETPSPISQWLADLPYVESALYHGEMTLEEIEELFERRVAEIRALGERFDVLEEDQDFLSVLMFANTLVYRGADMIVNVPDINIGPVVQSIPPLESATESIVKNFYNGDEHQFIFVTKVIGEE